MNSILSALRDEYALKRLRAEEALQARCARAYEKTPRLGEIAGERREAILALGLARATRADVSTLQLKLEQLEQEQAALLEMAGLTPDELALRFDCPLCSDTGTAGGGLCECMKKRLFAERYAHARLNPKETFETFDASAFPQARQKKLMLKAKALCEGYADTFPSNQPPGLMLLGKPGLGKTFLLNAIANRVFARGYSVAVLTAYRLVEQMQANIRNRTAQDGYLEPDLLIIDDLGSEPLIGSMTTEHLFSILNERQAQSRPTLFATNLTQAMVGERYGERMVSRLLSPMLSVSILLEGDDIRLWRANMKRN